jgi:hypothetical protein
MTFFWSLYSGLFIFMGRCRTESNDIEVAAKMGLNSA